MSPEIIPRDQSRVATVLEIREIWEKSRKVKKTTIVREKAENLNDFSEHRSFTVRFKLMILISTKMLYQEVRETSLTSGKSPGR